MSTVILTMTTSVVYSNINFLEELKTTNIDKRTRMLCNITRRQLLAISLVARSVLRGNVNPLKRDIRVLKIKRGLLRSLSANNVSFVRKKCLVKRNRHFVKVLLRTVYVVRGILDEISAGNET